MCVCLCRRECLVAVAAVVVICAVALPEGESPQPRRMGMLLVSDGAVTGFVAVPCLPCNHDTNSTSVVQ